MASLLDKAANEHHGMAGRYGGEEFVIAFPGKSLDEAYKIVKQIHEEIRDAVIEVDDMKADIRVSAGIASYPETCSNVEDILTRADWAMYHSKRNGRDQITVDSENISSEM